MPNKKLRNGKAYEHTILGMLTLADFDVYQPLVDDQGIDGVLRVAAAGEKPTRYYELQVKGSWNWGGIRGKIHYLSKQGVLILYCASRRELLWFLYEEVAQFFPAQNPDWGDIFLDQEKVSSFKAVTVATSASCVG